MLVQLDRVMKKYGSFALELNMEIPENQVTGLIGANGAGKSTTFKLMLGLIRPDEEMWRYLEEMLRKWVQRINRRLEPHSPTADFPNI